MRNPSLPLRLVLVLAGSAALPAAGVPVASASLDGSFAGLGTTGIVSVNENVNCHAVAPDGKIVLAGTYGTGIVIRRLLANGANDPTFGVNGRVLLVNQAYPLLVYSVAVGSQGDVYVGASTYFPSGTQDMIVTRVSSSGALDQVFGVNGWARIDIAFDDDWLSKVIVLPDGRVLVAGTAMVGGDPDFAVVRLSETGDIDATFSGNGRQTVPFGSDDYCYDMAVQDDGKIVLAGSTGVLDLDFAAARLNANGSFDTSFDGDGKLSTGFGGDDEARAVAIQADGKIVLAGGQHMARYSGLSGALDGTFDGDGKLSIGINAYDLVALPNGRLGVLGRIPDTNHGEYQVRNSNGSFDTNFGSTGIRTFQDVFPGPASLSVLPDGRVHCLLPYQAGACKLVRVWPNGATDTPGQQAVAFGSLDFPPGSDEAANALLVLPDGRIVVAGEVANPAGTEKDFAVVRLDASGNLDPGFGSAGRATMNLQNSDVARALAVQSDGKYLLGGYTGSNNAVHFMVARFQSNGLADGTYGFGGFNVLDFFGGADFGFAGAVAPDDKFVVAGTVWNGLRYAFGVARFTTSGIADASFGSNGKMQYELFVGQSHWATSVAVQSDRKVIVGGWIGTDFALVRFNENGTVDNTFGTNGHTVVDMGGNDYLYALAIAPNGWIYAAGSTDAGGHNKFAMLQCDPNGNPPGLCGLSCNHWPQGKAYHDPGGAQSAVAFALDIRSDGQILAAGCTPTYWDWVQLGPTSTTTVASGLVGFPGGNSCATSARFWGNDRVVLAGYGPFEDDGNMLLARFTTVPNSNVGVEEASLPVAGAVSFQPPWPNPAVRSTTFAFDLRQEGPVRLTLCDVAGRRVRTLADGALPAGRHTFLWDVNDDDGRRVADGIYFAALEAAGERHGVRVVVAH